MINIFLELERLRANLLNKGYTDEQVQGIMSKAEREINVKLKDRLDSALESAVKIGVDNQSADFINDLRPDPGAFIIETESMRTDFSEPAMPMLDRLLARSAKPIKDGSGVYKVIPVGGESSQSKRMIHTNIFDAQKAEMASRYENAKDQYAKVAPKKSVHFRTATSKQNRNTQWVIPEKEKDFTADLQQINTDLKDSKEEIILDVIRSYEESF